MDSQSRFRRAIDSQFNHLGRDAIYTQSNSQSLSVRIIARRPEQLFELGDGHMHAEQPQLEFRVSEVSSPSRGDEIEIEIDGRVYRIEAEPRLDLHQLVWVVPALPIYD